MVSDRWYCGCCGNKLDGPSTLWCRECKEHVAQHGHIWDRTWFAQTGKRCPLAGKVEVRDGK